MKVFISWSGHSSKKVAAILRRRLQFLLPNIQPWMSDTDIPAGRRWQDEVAHGLQNSQFGIICVTSENLNAPWLLFEAGALSNAVGETAVVPFLYDVTFSDLPGPLTQFQAKNAEKDDVLDLARAINQAMKAEAVPDSRLLESFEIVWPTIENDLKSEGTQLLKRYPEIAYQFYAERFGFGHGTVSFDCWIKEDGSAAVERTVEVEAFSRIESLDTFLLFPEASADNPGGLMPAELRSLDPARKVSYEEGPATGDRLGNELIFDPPLTSGERTTYSLVESATQPVFRLGSTTDDPDAVEKFGWSVYRPTRKLHLKVIFPLREAPTEYGSEVRRSSLSGFPSSRVEHTELAKLDKPTIRRQPDGRYVLTLDVDYPVFGFVYLLYWKPKAAA